jgi:hypothetical protein
LRSATPSPRPLIRCGLVHSEAISGRTLGRSDGLLSISRSLQEESGIRYYLDEFTFRFNRRSSKSRGKLFYRLVQQAVAAEPVPSKQMVKCFAPGDNANHNR